MNIFKIFTKEQVGGIVRTVLAGVSGYFIGKGWGDAVLWEAIGGAAVLLVTGLWSYKVKV
jgi:hypothetical protein